MMIQQNRKIVLAIALVAVACSGAWAQKKQFTIMEATNGMSTTLAPQSIKNASWQPGTDNLWQTEKKDGKDVWQMQDLQINSRVSDYITNIISQAEYPEKVAGIPAIKWLNRDEVYFVNGKDVLLGNKNNDVVLSEFKWKILASLPEKADHITIDKSKEVAYTIDNNLWYWSKANGAVAVTAEGDKNVVCGQSVHRDEFGIDHGIFFSPK